MAGSYVTDGPVPPLGGPVEEYEAPQVFDEGELASLTAGNGSCGHDKHTTPIKPPTWPVSQGPGQGWG